MFTFIPISTTYAVKFVQRVLSEVAMWSTLRHRNIIRVFGITTKFDYTISLITEWAEMGSAIDYVQNRAVDPRPLVSDVIKCKIGIGSQTGAFISSLISPMD